MKENVLEVNRHDLDSVEKGYGLSFLIALFKSSRPDFSISVIFTVITCPGMLDPQKQHENFHLGLFIVPVHMGIIFIFNHSKTGN